MHMIKTKSNIENRKCNLVCPKQKELKLYQFYVYSRICKLISFLACMKIDLINLGIRMNKLNNSSKDEYPMGNPKKREKFAINCIYKIVIGLIVK